MFTGIIEEMGTVRETTVTGGRAGHIWVTAVKVLEGTRVGDSISISGACQTAVELEEGAFKVEVMPETARRTTMGELRPGSHVNLERALAVGERLGGHLVNGHVDGVGTIRRRWTEENAALFEVGMPGELSRYVAPKGSIALEGISLTVVEKDPGSFTVSIIPHTLEETTLGLYGVGSRVNLEVDILAKYIESLLSAREAEGGLGRALLDSGFMTEE